MFFFKYWHVSRNCPPHRIEAVYVFRTLQDWVTGSVLLWYWGNFDFASQSSNLLDQLFLEIFKKCNLSQFLIRGGGWRIYLCVYTVQEHRAFSYLNNDAREDNIKRRGLFDTIQYSKCSNNLNAVHMEVNLRLFSLCSLLFYNFSPSTCRHKRLYIYTLMCAVYLLLLKIQTTGFS